MPDSLINQIIYFGGPLVLVLIILWMGSKLSVDSRKKFEIFKEDIQSHGFLFSDRESILHTLREFEIFSKKKLGWLRADRISYSLRGYYGGFDWVVFRYIYSQKNITKQDYFYEKARYIVACVAIENKKLPGFICAPRTFLNSLKSIFKSQKINLQEYPLFSRKYTLHGNPEQAVRQIFSGLFSSLAENPTFIYFEGKGNKLIFYIRENKAMNMDNWGGVEGFLKEVVKIAKWFW